MECSAIAQLIKAEILECAKAEEARNNMRHISITEYHLIIKLIAIIKLWERGKFSQKLLSEKVEDGFIEILQVPESGTCKDVKLIYFYGLKIRWQHKRIISFNLHFFIIL